MCGRLLVASQNVTLRRWSVQPCVRPVRAVRMTAGHNALRGPGPGQQPAFDDVLAGGGPIATVTSLAGNPVAMTRPTIAA
jgi:hypothetical protein